MKCNIEPLLPNTFYHIYNRGINGENLFKEERNYAYFLKKYAQYIEPIAETFAYCLLKNHFHLLIRTRSEEEIRKNLDNKDGFTQSEAVLNTPKHHDKTISWIISNTFSSLFKSYAQAINKYHKRTGSLFEEPFRRVWVDNDTYFTELIYYIHSNPQRHGFVEDFRNYPHSSYNSHIHTALTKLKRNQVVAWFGDKNAYEKFHVENRNLNNLDKFDIDFDL